MKKEIICHDINGKLHKVDRKKLIFRPSVYGILIEKGKILLFKQENGYDFPGGGLNITETLEQAFKREFYEETGVKVRMGKLVGCYSSFFYSKHRKQAFNAVLIYYLCQRVSGKLSNKHMDGYEKDHDFEPEWVDLKDIKKIKFQNPIDSVKLIKEAMQIK